MQPGQPAAGEDPMADQRTEENQVTAENRAARLLLAEHDQLAIDKAWTAVLQNQTNERFRERMEKVGWEQWRVTVAKRLDLLRFNELTRNPDAPPAEATTLF